MLGRMARTDDDAPSVGANPDFFAILDAAIAFGQCMDVFAEVAEAGLVVLNGPTAPASPSVKGTPSSGASRPVSAVSTHTVMDRGLVSGISDHNIKQIAADMKIGVELSNLSLQQGDAVCGALI